jgi:hypothetical protein
MASVAQVPASPVVRHGKCRLILSINGVAYKLRRHVAECKGAKVWSLAKVEVPAGYRGRRQHTVVRYQGRISCTCEDSCYRGTICKHARALVAAGVLSAGKSLPAHLRVPAPFPAAAPSRKEVQ